MGILRRVEQRIEARIEGRQPKRNLHYLEAARIIQRLLMNCKFKLDSRILLPNMFIVPFEKLSDVPPEYGADLLTAVSEALEGRGFEYLSGAVFQPVERSSVFPEVEVCWSDNYGKVSLGFIVGLEGAAAGKYWSIPVKGTTIGRSVKVPICVQDALMSRSHLKVKIVNRDRIIIEDLHSHNGTLIGKSNLVPGRAVAIKPGVKVTLGESVFAFYAFPNQYMRWSQVKSFT